MLGQALKYGDITMKNKRQLIFGLLLSLVSLIIMHIGAAGNLTLLVLSLICFLIAIAALIYWSTINYKWVCDECGENFEITLKQNFFGINARMNYKILYCSKSHKKTMCKGIKK